MRTGILAVLVTLAATATADLMRVDTWCDPSHCDSSTARWTSGFGEYYLNANEGCRDPPNVPSMTQLCVDWGNKRAHFYFEGQPRRCMRMTADYDWNAFANCHDLVMQCRRSEWTEVSCNW
jgi:hypothetical protein